MFIRPPPGDVISKKAAIAGLERRTFVMRIKISLTAATEETLNSAAPGGMELKKDEAAYNEKKALIYNSRSRGGYADKSE